MMDYKEMAEIVTREVDAILERKKIRAMRIKKVSLAVSGLCAAVIVCVGAWHFSSSMKSLIKYLPDIFGINFTS